LLIVAALLLCVGAAGDALAADKPKGVFDHGRTGFPLTGAHGRVRCESCHAGGVFKGLPRSCAGCHGRAEGVATSVRPSTHFPTTEQCESCHNTNDWKRMDGMMDHHAVLGGCSSCHNGRKAVGKPAGHIASSDNCIECHATTTWADAKFDHASVKGNCASCHDGRKATGKTPDHIASNDRCEQCHATSSWAAVRFDHKGVTGN